MVQRPGGMNCRVSVTICLEDLVRHNPGPLPQPFFSLIFFLTWEEADLCIRTRNNGHEVLLAKKPKVWHKVSQSFMGGSRGPAMSYYYTRNRFLWIEKNLHGTDKLIGLFRCLRELSWLAIDLILKHYNTPEEKLVIKAKLTGFCHYLFRRFGPSKKYSPV